MNAITLVADEPAHSSLGASSCKRWWNCPGSVRLSRGMPNRESIYAAEGTAAHALAEACLRTGQQAIEYIDRRFGSFTVDDEMADAVQIYLDHVRSRDNYGELEVEVRFNLAAIDPPAPMYGTCDAARYATDFCTLYIDDLKYGKRVQVYPDTPQLKYYALGAVLKLGRPVTKVVASIVQPRAYGNPVRTATMEAEELAEWSIELINRAKATQDPDAPLVPGEWCQFCPAAGQCPAQAAQAFEMAGTEFEVLDSTEVVRVPDVKTLTQEQKARAMNLLSVFEAFAKDLRTVVREDIEFGRGVPGWKLAPTRPTQSWIDPAAAEVSLTIDHELTEAECYQPRKVVSPAQARGVVLDRIYTAAKAAGRKMTKKDAEAEARKQLAKLIRSSSSGSNLVPDDDDRPALPAAGTEFECLPAPSQTVEA